MRIEPTREAGQNRRVDEDEKLRARHVDAKGLGGQRAATKDADGTANATIQQIAGGEQRQDDNAPDEHEKRARVGQRIGTDHDGRDAGQAIVRAKPGRVAEDVKEGDAPGDRAERNVVSRQAHRERADHERAEARHEQRRGQREPGRQAPARREHRTGVRAKTHEGRLPERCHAADAGQQDQSQRHETRDRDIVEQRDPVGRQREQREQQHRNRSGGREGAAQPRTHSSSSAALPPSERRSRNGRIMVKTSTSL